MLGQVLDGVSFDPLSHTEVRVDGTRLASLADTKGGFTLEGVPPGRYQILFSRSCHYPTRVEVTVPEDSPRPIVLRLSLPLASEESAEGNCILHLRQADGSGRPDRSALRTILLCQAFGLVLRLRNHTRHIGLGSPDEPIRAARAFVGTADISGPGITCRLLAPLVEITSDSGFWGRA